MVTFEQFKSMDIRIAKIVSAEDHPNADKLYVLTVDAGGETKKVVAGIKPYYAKEELPDKLVILLNNLEPAAIRGVQSEGMVLAAKDADGLTLLRPEKEVKIGSPVS